MADATQAAQTERKITIDGVEYSAGQLSETARQQVGNLRATDKEILHLEQQLAIYRTARAAYAKALKAQLEKPPEPTH
jgi:uncharacterized protein YjcR